MSALDEMPAAGELDGLEPTLPEPGAPVGRSLVDRVRARHEHRERTLDLPIPRCDGDVVARFGRLPRKALIAAAQGARRRSATVSNAELLATACREVFIRDEDGQLHPAAEGDGFEGQVRFDGRLADMFELRDAESPGDICIRMYADDVALARHTQRLIAWQTGEDLDSFGLEEVEDAAGEADAAT